MPAQNGTGRLEYRMNETGLNLLLADFVLVVHFIFVLFVVVGFLVIVGGRFIGWSWIYHRVFRIVHLVAIGFVIAQSYLGQLCPLTIWENVLRVRAGQGSYQESFIRHWLQRLLFYDAEPWQFGIVYTVFGILVLAATVVDWERINFRRRP